MHAVLADTTAPGTGFATLERALDLIGLFVFAVSGGMLAVRKGFEVVGVTSLALVTALGGGIVRTSRSATTRHGRSATSGT